ncbi:MAG: glycosyltransferase [Bacteroidales bacterium]
MKEELPLVSIICTAYNHEPYIKDALNGFIIQKTNFKFEVLISDDCSTDRTATIIKSYVDKYPGIFIPFYHEQNLYSQGIDFSDELYGNSKGKYIALCEGDDYWIDPLKLQKQVDFMESHPDYGLVHTNYKIVDEKNDFLPKFDRKWASGNVFEQVYNKDYHIVTPSVLFKKKMYDECKDKICEKQYKMGDFQMWLVFSYVAKVKFLNEIMVYYRLLPKSASHSESIKYVYDFQYCLFLIRRGFASKYNIKYNKRILCSNLYEVMVKECYMKNDPYNATRFYKKMLTCNMLNMIRIKPLMFLLGSHSDFWKKMITSIYKLRG